MPYCFYCGEEIYIILPFLRTKDCYCEKCKRITTVVTHRKTNEAELDKARREYQKNYFLKKLINPTLSCFILMKGIEIPD